MILFLLFFNKNDVHGTTKNNLVDFLHFNKEMPVNYSAEKLNLKPNKSALNAGFTYSPSGGCAPLLVSFNSQISGSNYEWKFGDGITISGAGFCNTTHVYTTAGNFTVTLNVTTPSGIVTYTDVVTVVAKPTGNITPTNAASVHCISGTDVFTFNPPSGVTYSYLWSVQNGSIVGSNTNQSVSVNWYAGGFNTVKVKVFNGTECFEYFSFTVYVMDLPKVAFHCCDARKPSHPNPGGTSEPQDKLPPVDTCNVCVNATNCYSADVSNIFGNVNDYTWTWTVTGGSIISGLGTPNICITWSTVGNGTIELSVKHNASGCERKLRCNVHVLPGLTPILNYSNPNCIGNVNFDLNSTINSSEIVWVKWEFGDGKIISGSSLTASNNYSDSGTFSVKVTVTNKAGCQFILTQPITINSGTFPTIVCVSTVCAGSSSTYSTANVGSSYVWEVDGDAVAGTVYPNAPSISVNWGNGPVGTVKVTVTGGGYTCSNEATVNVPIINTITPIEAPAFICQDLTSFTVSTENYKGACYTWSVSGGGSLQGFTANKAIINANPNSTSPIVINVSVNFGLNCCNGNGSITVNKKPRFFITGPNIVCENTSTGPASYKIETFQAGMAGFAGYNWTVTGGSPASTAGPTNSVFWGAAGTGQIMVTNYSPTFCNSSATYDVKIVPKATGDDITGPKVLCVNSIGNYFFGYDASKVNAVFTINGIVQPQIPTLGNVNYNFTTPGVYTLIVNYSYSTGVADCGTSDTLIVNVLPATLPTINMISPTAFVCQGSKSQFWSNISLLAGGYQWEVNGGTFTENVVGAISTITVTWNSTVNTDVKLKNVVCGNEAVYPMVVRAKPTPILHSNIFGCDKISADVTNVWTSYQWKLNTTLISTSNAISTVYINPANTNTLELITELNQCYDTQKIVVAPHTIPSIGAITFVPNNCTGIVFCDPTVEVTAGTITGGVAPFKYVWVSNSVTYTGSVVNIQSVSSGTGTWSINYTLTVTDAYGCVGTKTGTITGVCTPPVSCSNKTLTITSWDPCTRLLNYSLPYPLSCITGPVLPVTCGNAKTVSLRGYNTTSNCWETFTNTVNVPYILEMTSLIPSGATNCAGATGVKLTASHCVTSAVGAVYTAKFDWYVDNLPIFGFNLASGNALMSALNPSITTGIHEIKVIARIYLNSTTIACEKTLTTYINLDGLLANFNTSVCGYCANNPVTFTDASIPYKAPIIRWDWTITGPNSYASNLQNPTFNILGSALPYSCTLRIIDDYKCTATIVKTFYVHPTVNPGAVNYSLNASAPAVASTTSAYLICKGDNFKLIAPYDPTFSYVWSNGSTGQILTVTNEGEYYVTITESTRNCTFKKGPFKVIYKPNPRARFILPSTPYCTPLKLQAFEGNGYTYSWFPSAAISPSNAPTAYIYSAGTYNVYLTVTNMFGCSNTSAPASITVYPSPSVVLTAAPWCPPGAFPTINSTATGGTPSYSYTWSLNGTTLAGTGASLASSAAGTYQVNVTDSKGCTAKNSTKIQYEIPAVMSTIPEGCYTTCTTATFCAGVVPYGYKGRWYKNGSIYDSTLTAGANIGISINSTGVYVFELSATPSSSGCVYKSKPLDVTITPLPTITITGAVNNQALCPPTTSLTLTASQIISGYVYSWTKNGSAYGIGSSVVITTPGTYQLTVSNDCNCSTSASIIINPCNSPSCDTTGFYFSKIKVIDQNLTVSNSQLWEGKFYVMPNVTITVTGAATLDLTNVDMLFDENSGMLFNDNAKIRANNSVFRPCDPNHIWNGMAFVDYATGWINTCTYKNAKIAVNIVANYQNGVRLTDNTFSKCNIGVNIEEVVNNQSISGNSFEIESTNLPYGSTDYFGIKLKESSMEGLISNNRFRQVSSPGNANLYFGIYAFMSSFTASTNTFIDMHRGIDIVSSTGIVGIEKNTFQTNQLYSNFENQLRAVGCNYPVLIYSNNFDMGVKRSSATTAAIYLSSGYGAHVKSNSINQWGIGIYMERYKNASLVENTITNGMNTGIHLNSNYYSSVSCNSITMQQDQSSEVSSFISTGVYLENEDPSSNIFTNCILNATNSVWASNGITQNLPLFKNNYLYNYYYFGMLNLGYSGNIGTDITFADAGRNTFMSNNNGLAFDVLSFPTIQSDGNYGLNTTWGANMFYPTDIMYSTAKCGLQIHPDGYRKMQQDALNICDHYYLGDIIVHNNGGGFEFMKRTDGFNSNLITEKAKLGEGALYAWIYSHVTQSRNDAELNAALNVVKSSNLTVEVKLQLISSALIKLGKYNLLSTMLNESTFAGANDDLKYLLSVKTSYINNSFSDSSNVVNKLAAIENAGGTYALMARDLSHCLVHNHDYVYSVNKMVYIKPSNIPSRIEIRERELKAYPVPATNELFVKLSNANEVVKAVRIYNAVGSELFNYDKEINAGVIKLDIRHFSQGVYYIQVVSDDKTLKPLSTRFIKN